MCKTVLQAMCVLLLSAAGVWSQTVSGTLSGRVTSATGAGIANAAVTVTDSATNTSQKVLTGPDGTFTVSGLAPGAYRIVVETAGYKRTTQQNIELTAAGPATVSITLEAGNMNETVEIRGHAPVTQGQSGEVSIGLGTRTVRELPVIDRNHQELIGLFSGITPPVTPFDMVRDPERNRLFSSNGQEAWNNQFGLDGVVNQEPFRNTAIRVQPVESLQQMNVATASQTMDKGFTGGANVMNLTRGGTNGLHGSLFEFYSGNVLRTRPFYDTVGDSVPRYVHNQMGATLGGAIVPDRTFLFGSYEGLFDNGSNSVLSTVPTAAAIGGNFSGIPGLTLYNPNSGSSSGAGRTPFTGGVIPSSRINPTAAAIASFIPSPNLPGFYNNYLSAVPFRNHANRADGRLDQHFSDRTSAFVRYGYTNNWAAMGSPLGNVIGAGTRNRLLAQNAIVDFTHEITGAFITDFRFGYNRYDQKINALADQGPLAGLLGAGSLNNNLIGINISGFSPIGAPAYLPEHAVDNTFNWVWTFGWHRGVHNVKWGVDVRRNRSDGFTDTMWGSLFGPNGTAYFGPGATLANGAALSPYGSFYNAFGGFLLGAPSQVGVVNYLTTPTIRQTQYGVWLGDTVQFMRRFTLDLGVRYEVYSPLEPRSAGGAAFFDPATNSFNFAGIGSTGMHGVYDVNNVAPRIGLAAQITPRTVFRAGYSINYFQSPYMLSGFMAPVTGAATGVQGTYAVALAQGIFGPTVSSTTPAPGSLVNGAAAGNLPATVVPRSVDTPYVQSFSAQLQQEFVRGTMLSVGYAGALGRHLSYIQELNAAMPGTGVAGLPFASLDRTASTLGYQNGLTSNYNSLQATLSKRFSEGLSFLASYTWSKALGYTGSNGLLLNPFDLRSNYGPLDYDRQHVLAISHLWELPFGLHGNNRMASIIGGWQLNGVFMWSTGTPLTVTADPLTCACPGNTVFASMNGSPYLNSGFSYLNPGAFSAPGPGQFGTLGRGALRGPDGWNYNLSLFKNFRVAERVKLEIRGEAYNLTNSTHFANPVTNINSPAFGQTWNTAYTGFGRQINLGLRATF
jgi:hypothetical protein